MTLEESDEAETGLSRPNSLRMMMKMTMVFIIIIIVLSLVEGKK